MTAKAINAKNQRAAIEVFPPMEIKRLARPLVIPMVHFDSTKLSTRRLLLNFAPTAVLYSGSKERPRYPWPANQVCPPSASDKALHISHEDKRDRARCSGARRSPAWQPRSAGTSAHAGRDARAASREALRTPPLQSRAEYWDGF